LGGGKDDREKGTHAPEEIRENTPFFERGWIARLGGPMGADLQRWRRMNSSTLRTIVGCLFLHAGARADTVDFRAHTANQIANNLCALSAKGELAAVTGISGLAYLDPAARSAFVALEPELKAPAGIAPAYKVTVVPGDHLRLSDKITHSALIRTPTRSICLRFAKRDDRNLDLIGFAFGEVDFIPRGKLERVRFVSYEVSRPANAGKDEIVARLEFLDENGKQRTLRVGDVARGATVAGLDHVPRAERGTSPPQFITYLRMQAPDNVTYLVGLGGAIELPLLEAPKETATKKQ
jgi:hypothetical protein